MKAPTRVVTPRLILVRRESADAVEVFAEQRASRRVLEKCGFVRDVTRSEQAEFPSLSPGVLQDVHRYGVAFDRARCD